MIKTVFFVSIFLTYGCLQKNAVKCQFIDRAEVENVYTISFTSNNSLKNCKLRLVKGESYHRGDYNLNDESIYFDIIEGNNTNVISYEKYHNGETKYQNYHD